MARNIAPSIYGFRSESEWDTAMAEWCAENEPRYFVTYFVPDAGKYGAWERVEVATEEEARKLCDEKHNPELDEKPYIVVAPGGRTSDGTIIRPFGELGYTSGGIRISDHLPGGSASDYRMAGYHRF